MAENSRKNEFFERESIAMIAMTTSSSINVKCFFINFCSMLNYSAVTVTFRSSS